MISNHSLHHTEWNTYICVCVSDLGSIIYLILIKYKIWVIVFVIVFLAWKLYVFVFAIQYFPNAFKYLQLLQILLLQ